MTPVPQVTDALFGERIKALRGARDWSLRELGDRSGVALATVHRYETGRPALLSNAARIAWALGVSLADMIQPPRCSRCLDAPPAGFTCRACGIEGEEPQQ